MTPIVRSRRDTGPPNSVSMTGPALPGAGERMFVDFSPDKVPVTDATTGQVAQAGVFVDVLGCSGMLDEIPMRSSPAWSDFAGAARVGGVM